MRRPKRSVRILFWIVAALLITLAAWFGQRQYVAYQEERQHQMVKQEIERLHQRFEELSKARVDTFPFHGSRKIIVTVTSP